MALTVRSSIDFTCDPKEKRFSRPLFNAELSNADDCHLHLTWSTASVLDNLDKKCLILGMSPVQFPCGLSKSCWTMQLCHPDIRLYLLSK